MLANSAALTQVAISSTLCVLANAAALALLACASNLCVLAKAAALALLALAPNLCVLGKFAARARAVSANRPVSAGGNSTITACANAKNVVPFNKYTICNR
jgi:hypothetical protein